MSDSGYNLKAEAQRLLSDVECERGEGKRRDVFPAVVMGWAAEAASLHKGWVEGSGMHFLNIIHFWY